MLVQEPLEKRLESGKSSLESVKVKHARYTRLLTDCIGEQNNLPNLDLFLWKMVQMLLQDGTFGKCEDETHEMAGLCGAFNIQKSRESLMNGYWE